MGDNNNIGPWCIIGEDVILGDDNNLISNVNIDKHTYIGNGNRFFHGASVGSDPQDLKFDGSVTYLKIGDDNSFREFVTLNRSATTDEDTTIGNGCLIMAYAHVAHNCHIGNNVILANAVNLAGHIHIADFVSVGGMVAIHQFVKIGRYAFVGGKSGVKKDVPPFTRGEGFPYKIRGLNSVGLQRKGFSTDQIKAIKDVYRLLYRMEYNTTQAMEKIAKLKDLTPEQIEFIDFVKAAERGLTR